MQRAAEWLQVYDMDAKLVDARRPKIAKPSPAHREQRLLPYKPEARPPCLHASLVCAGHSVMLELQHSQLYQPLTCVC